MQYTVKNGTKNTKVRCYPCVRKLRIEVEISLSKWNVPTGNTTGETRGKDSTSVCVAAIGICTQLELRGKYEIIIIITLSRLCIRRCRRQNTAARIPVIKTRRRDVIIYRKKSVQYSDLQTTLSIRPRSNHPRQKRRFSYTRRPTTTTSF